ncbi:MAG TPA: cytidine deaminase [candidate division Zixibacteria bacterium]|nr:cytidine deaminase [candidate division Zixibacteria bacterium]HER00531.1 cytidine deaminase [candidate division Zixibacteria bacterium]
MISLEDKALEKAKAARENSYSPYSGFRVGAAVISGDDRIFAGTNIENRSYGLTICAERSAIFSAVSKGVRTLRHLVLITDSEKFITPCGACLQVLSEFASDMQIESCNKKGEKQRFSLKELLPKSFKLE